MRIAALVRGLPGHPLHSPMTEGAIGAYAAATVLVVAGAAGGAEKEQAEAG